jgi:hypothetical protein
MAKESTRRTGAGCCRICCHTPRQPFATGRCDHGRASLNAPSDLHQLIRFAAGRSVRQTAPCSDGEEASGSDNRATTPLSPALLPYPPATRGKWATRGPRAQCGDRSPMLKLQPLKRRNRRRGELPCRSCGFVSRGSLTVADARRGESDAFLRVQSIPSAEAAPADRVPTRRLFTAHHARERLSTRLAQKPGLCSTIAAGRLLAGTAN